MASAQNWSKISQIVDWVNRSLVLGLIGTGVFVVAIKSYPQIKPGNGAVRSLWGIEEMIRGKEAMRELNSYMELSRSPLFFMPGQPVTQGNNQPEEAKEFSGALSEDSLEQEVEPLMDWDYQMKAVIWDHYSPLVVLAHKETQEKFYLRESDQIGSWIIYKIRKKSIILKSKSDKGQFSIINLI